MANFKIKRAVGGKVEGPSHESCGVPVVSKGLPATEPQTGAQYEIEGGERVFSIDDTSEMERIAGMIAKASPQKKDELYNHLGKRVTEMIAAQDGSEETLKQEGLDLGAAAGNVADVEPIEYID